MNRIVVEVGQSEVRNQMPVFSDPAIFAFANDQDQ